jgi:hypothetical protein
MRKPMKLHYYARNKDICLAEIDKSKYVELLEKYDGRSLATQIEKTIAVVENTPFDGGDEYAILYPEAEAFFHFNDVADGITTAEDLMEELRNPLYS